MGLDGNFAFGEDLTDEKLRASLTPDVMVTLYRLQMDILAQREIGSLLQHIAEDARLTFGADLSFLYIYNPETGMLDPRATSVADDHWLAYSSISVSPGKGVCGVSFSEGRPAMAMDYDTWEGRLRVHGKTRSLAQAFAVPLHRSRDDVIGSMTLSFIQGRDIDAERTFALLQAFSSIASLALTNAYERDIILSLNDKLEKRNEEQKQNLMLTENTLFRRNVELMDLLKELETVQARERRRIAADMHDDALQYLYGVNALLQAATVSIDAGRYDSARNSFKMAQKYVASAETAIRTLLSDLRQQQVDSEFAVVVRDYAQVLVNSEKFKVSCIIDEGLPDISADTQAEALRVIQEAVANVEEHAHAQSLRIELRAVDGGVMVMIADDGVGMQLEEHNGMHLVLRENHYGMQIMHERSESVGARLSVSSEPGKGTIIRMFIPPAPHNAPGVFDSQGAD